MSVITNTVASVTELIRKIIKDPLKANTSSPDYFTFNLESEFPLSEDYVSASTIRVFKNGVEAADADWYYDVLTNRVVIDYVDSGEDLVKGDLIKILYSYYNKYSDSEIADYIENALSYFVQFRYKKLFYIDSSSTIIAAGDYDPTVEELNLLATITAIIIDPQNIKVRTQEYSIEGNRKKSDQEQIAEVFTKFRRFVGSFTFIEDDV